MSSNHYDVIVAGSGPGGASVAYGLAQSGAKVLMLERGDYLPSEPQNWEAEAVFGENRYKSGEQWWDERLSRPFRAGVHYWVGGNSKMYGAALTRPRRTDFEKTTLPGGVSPAWPINYDELRPFYSKAEDLFRVHGNSDEDPGEPEHSGPYPFGAIPHEPYVAQLANGLARQGLTPLHLPTAIDLRDGGSCIYCSTCDGFPCRVRAKSDAETCLVKPALATKNLTLITNAFVKRLNTAPSGREVRSVQVVHQGQPTEFTADIFVLGCGAINSAALLLRSANPDHPNGLGNGSGMVGRNYMMNNNAVVIALDPRRRNSSVFQKTLFLNDWYSPGEHTDSALGSAQLIGKMQGSMLKGAIPLMPGFVADWIAAHSHEWWLLGEDLPDPNNQVKLGPDGSLRFHYTPNNTGPLRQLAAKLKGVLRGAGFPVILTKYPGLEVTSHQAGTVRFGNDPATSVLNAWCRSHEVGNLYVVDGSFFPSLPAMGPTLTIIAQGLRVAQHIAAS